MAAVSDEDFEEALNDDFGWRRVELAHLKRTLSDAAKAREDSPATRGLSRAMVAVCYAHWEGYSRNALERYAVLLSRRKPKLSLVSDGLLIEHMQKLLRRISSGDGDAREVLASVVRGEIDERIGLDRAMLANTRSNLRFSVLEELFERGCIPIEAFELRANLIDVHLCDRRNEVAHGRALFVSAEDSSTLCDEALALMGDMRDVLMTQVRAKKYLRQLPAELQPETGS